MEVYLAIIDNRRVWNDYFSINLMDLVETTKKEGINVRLGYFVANSVETMRNLTVLDFLKSGADYYMALDTDMEYPSDLIIKMVNHNKDIVVPKLYRRTPPYSIVQAYKYHFPFWEESNLLKEDKKGLVKVEISGPPGMLIKRKVFEDIYNKTGDVWFNRVYEFRGPEDWNKKTVFEIGSDVRFCEKVKNAGYEIWVDTDFDIPHECGDFFVFNGEVNHKTMKRTS